jgi:hypothetical protein
MRVGGVKTMEQANHYLEKEFLPWVNSTLAVTRANKADAHRPLEKHHNLAAILSHVESRRVNNDYTIQLEGRIYQIALQSVCTGLRGCPVGAKPSKRPKRVCADVFPPLRHRGFRESRRFPACVFQAWLNLSVRYGLHTKTPQT